MGDVTDMMLDGTLCEACGSALPKNNIGVPLVCFWCAKDRRAEGHTVEKLGRDLYQDLGIPNRKEKKK